MSGIEEFRVDLGDESYSYNITNAKVLKETDEGCVEVDEDTQIAVHMEFWRRYGPTILMLQQNKW